jgi:asparagine synthase (glutamine-hydrolysing)
MCGVVGIVDLRGAAPIDHALIERMSASLVHRGPDQDGEHFEPGVGLAHRRLSIIDLSGGRQPLFNEDETVVAVYNGEIYNFQVLIRELEGLGHRFRTRCDTEVIVHAWEEWGEDCVRRFRGMFAFGLWDRNRETLFLARDRLGIKPLYYAHLSDGKIAFASELKALTIHPGISKSIDPRAVEDYFALGYVPDPRTIFAEIKKLPPATTLVRRRGGTNPGPKEYWDVPFKSDAPQNEHDLEVELVERLREAVRIRLVSEVPLGAFLSGGIDSSAVVSLMAGLEQGKPVNTCSIGFGERGFNETEFAELVARRYHTDHMVERVDPNDYSLVDALAGLYDEPFADSSAIPTYRVCELARRRVTVALSGDGGDENFAGYRRHRWHMNEERIRRLLPQAMRRPVFGVLGRVYPKMDWAPKPLRAKSTLEALSRSSLDAYLDSVGVVPDRLRPSLFSTSLRSELQGYRASEVFRHHASRCPTDDPLSLVQYLDMKTYLPGDILTKVDRASMAHSLEVRVPILDHEFVEWVSGIPASEKLKGREGKYVFKKALEPLLPAEVLYRDKMGFGVPLGTWFRGELRNEVRSRLLGPGLSDSGFFDTKTVRRLVDQHQSGLGEHSAVLWSLLMFEAFLRRHGGSLDLAA